MTKDYESRQSFRVVESALIQFEVISDSDFEQGLDMWNIRAGAPSSIRSKLLDLDTRIDETLFRAKNIDPAINDVIRLMNQKLNTTLEALPEFRDSRASLTDQRAQVCELSSEGMAFESTEDLGENNKLLLRFLLISDNRFFETFCRVVRVLDEGVQNSGSDPDTHRIAVQFHDMNRAEREILIQHLFSKQSETLRLKRIQSEQSA